MSHICPVKHVHWLHAHAQKDQWHEEVVLITYEMQWTVRYFLHKNRNWEEGAVSTTSPGGVAYALWQGHMWRKMADLAFKNMTSHYMSPCLDIK